MFNPQVLLVGYNKKYSSAWRRADEFRADRGKDLPDWPAWCFLPLAGWYAIVCEAQGVSSLPMHMVSDMEALAALGSWRPSQDIYRFDGELYSALVSTPLEGDIPCSILYHFPVWCAYIETPSLEYHGMEMRGFFAHLENDARSGAHELRLLLDMGEHLSALPIHLGQWSLAESLHRLISIAENNALHAGISAQDIAGMREEMLQGMDTIRACVNLVLYLCADCPDARGPLGTSYTRGYPRSKKTKGGWRLFPPPKPTIWHMGEAVGEAIRKHRQSAPQGGTHASPRPHIRRAHWHGFWSGTIKPKRGAISIPRTFSLKWLPPMPVAISEDE